MYKLSLRQPAFLRLYHWLQFLLLTIIISTGLYIHHPLQADWLNFGRIFSFHAFAGFLFSYLLMARTYYAVLNENYKTLIFTWQDLKELPAVFKYYLFFRSEKPPEKKYNSGQRMLNTQWFILLSLTNISGTLTYKKTHFLPVAKLVGGLHHLDWLTLGVAFFMVITIPLHIYLAFTENTRFLQSMLTGYVYTLKPGGVPPLTDKADFTRTRLPGLWLLNKARTWLAKFQP